MQSLHMTDRTRRCSGSAGRSIALGLASILFVAAACGEPTNPTPAVADLSPSFGKGGNGGGGGGGGSTASAKIVFLNGPGVIERIVTMNPDGSSRTAVTQTGEYHSPVWSPDYKKIAYTVGDGGFPPIYVMNANGTRPEQIGNGLMPRWSPNGQKIAFHKFASVGGGPIQSDIFVMNADGSNVIRLTVDPEFDGYPTWSPDGNRIAFESRRLGTDEIFVMNADGTGQARVTYCAVLAANCRAPRWSPAAGDERILYTFFGAAPSLRTITAAGGSGTTVLPGLSAFDAAWSPDATKLTFSYVAPALVKPNIYTARLDGTELTRLTFDTVYPETNPQWTR
jgi:TolB protein